MRRINSMRHTRRATLLLLIGLLAALSLAGCGPAARGHFEKGNALYEEMQFAEAVEEYEKALELEPDNVDVMSNLGVTYYRLGKLDEAIEVYNRAITAAPEDADIRSNLAAAYVQKQGPDGGTDYLNKALEQYQKAIELQPDLAEAHYGAGTVYALMGQVEEAIQEFVKFQDLDKGNDPRATENAAAILEQLRGQ
jgi:tetratricopeptide (TPR) repeat protein